MNKALRFLQVLWFSIGCIALVFSVYMFITGDNEGGIFFLFFTFVCGIMYAIRKRQGSTYGSSAGKPAGPDTKKP